MTSFCLGCGTPDAAQPGVETGPCISDECIGQLVCLSNLCVDPGQLETGGAEGGPQAGDGTSGESTSASTTSASTDTLTSTSSPSTSSASGADGEDDDDGCQPGSLGCSCAGGDWCEGLLECDQGLCVLPPCEQEPGEPNDIEAQAIELGTLSCYQSEWLASNGAVDIDDTTDWYAVDLTNASSFSCQISAAAGSETPVHVCMYGRCTNGDNALVCADPSVGATSPAGVAGCCQAGSEVVKAYPLCLGGQSSARIYVRVRRYANIAACIPYTVYVGTDA